VCDTQTNIKKLEKLKYITELTDRSDIIDDREERMLEEAIYEEIRHMKATERIKYIQRIKTSAASYSLGNLYVYRENVRSPHADFFEYYSGSDGQQ
jgi:hypothetical protein